MSTPHLHPLLMQGTLSHLALSLGRWVGDRLPGRSVTGRWMGECAGSMAIDRWGMGSSIHRSKFGQDYAFPNHWRMKIHVYPFVSGNFGVKTRAFDQDSWNHEGCCNPMLCCLFIADSIVFLMLNWPCCYMCVTSMMKISTIVISLVKKPLLAPYTMLEATNLGQLTGKPLRLRRQLPAAF